MAVTIVVGFGSAVIGGIVVLLGSLYMETRRIRRTRTGMVRALIAELQQNGATAIQALYGGTPAMEYSSETWRAANFELAQFLDEALYRDVVFVYMVLPAIERLSSRPLRSQQLRALLEDWLQRVKKAMSGLLQSPEAAKFRPEWEKFLARLDDIAKKAASEGEGLADKATQNK